MILEILALVALGLATLIYLSTKTLGQGALWAAGALAVVPVATQLAANGYYWQMVPAYAVAGVLTAIVVRRWMHGSSEGRSRITRATGIVGQLGIVGLVAASSLSLYAFPIFQLPAPTGPHDVRIRQRRDSRPSDWNVRVEGASVLGSVEDNRRTSTALPPGTPTLVIDATAVLDTPTPVGPTGILRYCIQRLGPGRHL